MSNSNANEATAPAPSRTVADLLDLTDRDLDVVEACSGEHWALARLVGEVRRHRAAMPNPSEHDLLWRFCTRYMPPAVLETTRRMLRAYRVPEYGPKG